MSMLSNEDQFKLTDKKSQEFVQPSLGSLEQ